MVSSKTGSVARSGRSFCRFHTEDHKGEEGALDRLVSRGPGGDRESTPEHYRGRTKGWRSPGELQFRAPTSATAEKLRNQTAAYWARHIIRLVGSRLGRAFLSLYYYLGVQPR